MMQSGGSVTFNLVITFSDASLTNYSCMMTLLVHSRIAVPFVMATVLP